MLENNSTLILDIGAGTIKSGFNNDNEPRIIDNCLYKAKNVANKTFIGSELNDCNNLSGLFPHLPFKKGYINNWELQKQILDYLMKDMFAKADQSIMDTNVIITEPVFNFSPTRETMQEIFFEEYQCNGLLLTTAPFLIDYKHRATFRNDWSFVIDSGYSFTTFVPIHKGVPLYDCAKRMTIGGKVLTNRLIEVISYGQLDVRNEVYIMNQCKEDVCFVSTKFSADLNDAKFLGKRSKSRLQYILPDYINNRRGYVSTMDTVSRNQDEYSISLNNERFLIPELLFHPSDVGYDEMGLVEALSLILNDLLPENAQLGCYDNIILSGGNCCFPGFEERLNTDLRACAPEDFPVNVFVDKNPQLSAWYGGQMLANKSADMAKYLVTRSEYNERGAKRCEEKYPI